MKTLKQTLAAFLFVCVSSLCWASGAININSADADTLASGLTGVGAKKAQAIVEYRNENGPFKTVEGLTAVKGIGDKVLQDNLERLSVDNHN